MYKDILRKNNNTYPNVKLLIYKVRYRKFFNTTFEIKNFNQGIENSHNYLRDILKVIDWNTNFSKTFN